MSAAALRKIESGTAPTPRAAKRLALMRALRWPPDALDRLAEGDDPHALDGPATTSSGGSPVEVAILSDPGLDDIQKDLLLVAYRGAVDRTRKARSGQIHSDQHRLG